ncbi:MAG TPA: DUF1178 family protein [Burkholderiales bacterium]|nr:DUF1178 family protein [Burkholderiales bacterium]
MIIYDLTCDQEHRFEGWFASAAEYARQSSKGLVECPLCGSSDTRRVVSASYVHTSGAVRSPEPDDPAEERGEAYYGAGTRKRPPTEALSKLVRYIVENTEDVGSDFPDEARRIHYREAEQRQIRGTASREEVTDLRDEGIEVVSLPFELPNRGKSH